MLLFNIKPLFSSRCSLAISLLVSFFLVSGCARNIVLAPSYVTPAGTRPIVPPEQHPVIRLVVHDRNDTCWFKTDQYACFLRDTPAAIIQDALIKELTAMGIDVAISSRADMHRLETAIRWFAPFGEDFRWTGIILSFALYEKNTPEPIWRGKTEGAGGTKRSLFMVRINPSLLEEAMVRAIQRAIRELKWDSGFNRAVNRLIDQDTRQYSVDGGPPQE